MVIVHHGASALIPSSYSTDNASSDRYVPTSILPKWVRTGAHGVCENSARAHNLRDGRIDNTITTEGFCCSCDAMLGRFNDILTETGVLRINIWDDSGCSRVISTGLCVG